MFQWGYSGDFRLFHEVFQGFLVIPGGYTVDFWGHSKGYSVNFWGIPGGHSGDF